MSVPQAEKSKKPVGHLKALALQVLKRSVPLSHTLESGTVGHPAPAQETHLDDAQNSWEWITERAAIMKYDAGLSRTEADYCAFMAWYRRFVEGKVQ